MISYADNSLKQEVRNMWKTCFGDSDAYMDIYFSEKYRSENTLIYFDDGKAVASLQMLPYLFTFHGMEIPVAYFSGLCTLPQARKRGFMSSLIRQAYAELEKRNVPIALLVPQEKQLLDFYNQFGFAQTFDAGEDNLYSLHDLTERHESKMNDAYAEFDSWFRGKDMVVQKTFDDFRAIVAEARLFGFPPKKNLIGMARIIDAERLLKIFAASYPEKAASFTITDELIPRNNDGFIFHMGRVVRDPAHQTNFQKIDIRRFAQCLLGYHTSEMGEPFRILFPEKTPQMNFMLE